MYYSVCTSPFFCTSKTNATDQATIHISNLTRHDCSCSLDGTIVDTTPLVCLYLLARLLQAELEKCLRLVSNLPVQDMETYLGNNNNIQLSESI